MDRIKVKDRINQLESKKKHLQSSNNPVYPFLILSISIMMIMLIYELGKPSPSLIIMGFGLFFLEIMVSLYMFLYLLINKKCDKYQTWINKNYNLLLNKQKKEEQVSKKKNKQ